MSQRVECSVTNQPQGNQYKLIISCVLVSILKTDSLNIAASSFSQSIPDNAKPNYVLLLAKGLGESCDQYKK
jgi:hypothetical protein